MCDFWSIILFFLETFWGSPTAPSGGFMNVWGILKDHTDVIVVSESSATYSLILVQGKQ